MRILKDKRPLDKLYKRRNRYDLQPDYQRDKVWNKEDKQKLLDTVLRKWDIPKIYLHVIDEENFEVVDGQQRLTAVYDFYDNEIELSEEFSNEYGGLTYEDLPDRVKDIFDDYEIDFVLIERADNEELKELFARLQLGKPLNSGEKLNAIHGKLRDFAKELTKSNFFKMKIAIRDTRHSHLSIAGQMCILGIKGIENLKFKDINSLFTSNVNFNPNSDNGKRMKNIVTFLDQAIDEGFKLIKNRAAVTTIFALISNMTRNGFLLNTSNSKKIGRFYMDFLDELRVEIEKGAASKNPEFILYQSNVTQGADSSTSLRKRLSILRTKLITNYPEFQKYFELQSSELELIDYKRKETISNITDECLSLLVRINEIYKSKKGEDLFKPTNENFKSSVSINKPTNNEAEFKAFIDSLYKIIYEGSGSLKRIPRELLLDEAIYFDIKHLRTDYFHDIEHGSKNKIEKKQNLIGKIYEKYTGKKSLPQLEIGDLIKFQKALLKNLATELKQVEVSIKSG